MNLTKQKFAITGGGGLVASNIIKRLNEEGITQIDVYDKLDSLSKKIHNIVGLDITGIYDYKTLLQDSVITQYDHIIHMGASSATTTKPEDYEKVLDQNFYFTKRLLQLWSYYSVAHCKSHSKFIFASSGSVYGNSSDFTERTIGLRPPHLYGKTKQLCDIELENYYGGHKAYSFRFFNCAGFNEKHKIERNMASPISKFLTQEPPFVLYRDENKTEFKRDFIHVKDVADVIYHTLVNDCPAGCYNLGSGQGTTWEELVKAVCEARGLNYENSIQYAPLPDALKGQYQAVTVANLEKLRNNLGYKGEFMGIREIVKDIFNQE